MVPAVDLELDKTINAFVIKAKLKPYISRQVSEDFITSSYIDHLLQYLYIFVHPCHKKDVGHVRGELMKSIEGIYATH